MKLWLRWRALLIPALVFALAIAGASYEVLGSRADAKRFSHPGRLVAAGDALINVYCTGQGSPTVVLEAGFGDSLESWRRVQPEIARFTRVCSYDRAGYGRSLLGPLPRTSSRIAEELNGALKAAGEKAPFVLVGHSFGGFNVRVFNGAYPEEVSGLVLVDATQEDQYHLLPRAWAELSAATRRRLRQQAFWAPLYVGLGIARLQLRLQGGHASPLLVQSKYLRARASELENVEVSAEQARKTGDIADKPLVVLTAGKPVDSALRASLSEADCQAFESIWIDDLQQRLAALSTPGTRRVLPGCGHDLPTECPEAIVGAVREMID